MDLFSDDLRRDPYPAYAQLRHASILFHEPRPAGYSTSRGLWMVFDYDGVRRVLADHAAFSSRYGPDWILFMDPPRHTKLRALISHAFTPRSIAGLEARIRELSRGLLDGFAGRSEIDLAAGYSIPLPMLVIAELLGVPPADRARCTAWSDTILNMSHSFAGTEGAARAEAEFAAATAEMNVYLAGLLDERRIRPRDDLLSRLVHAEVDGQRLTREEILGFFQALLAGGQETTTNLINNAVLCLLEHPEQTARLQDTPGLLPSTIEEVLRYRSPLQWMYRLTTRDVEMHGQTIPAGSLVLAMIGSANRDPRQFPAAERFDITREPNAHIAFGHGIHFCLGAPLARLEARIAIADILERLPDLQLASSEPWPPRRALHVHGPDRLMVRFTSNPGSAHRNRLAKQFR